MTYFQQAHVGEMKRCEGPGVAILLCCLLALARLGGANLNLYLTRDEVKSLLGEPENERRAMSFYKITQRNAGKGRRVSATHRALDGVLQFIELAFVGLRGGCVSELPAWQWRLRICIACMAMEAACLHCLHGNGGCVPALPAW
ncbi:hypothetical protein FHG87_014778 [Trinorchestia longiramus]|nr:hypothetical protein FHG87_014778 [Trinorchestia longiramus]